MFFMTRENGEHVVHITLTMIQVRELILFTQKLENIFCIWVLQSDCAVKYVIF